MHGHKSPEILMHHDFGLQTAIKLINEIIRVTNRRNRKKSPNFNAAIEKPRKETIASPTNTGGHLTSFWMVCTLTPVCQDIGCER